MPVMQVFHTKSGKERGCGPEDLQHLREAMVQQQEIFYEKSKLFSSDATAKVRAEMTTLHDEVMVNLKNAEETRKADVLDIKTFVHECASRLQQEIKVVAQKLEERMHDEIETLDTQLREHVVSEDAVVTVRAQADLNAYQQEVRHIFEMRSAHNEEIRIDQKSQLQAAIAMLRQESSGLFEKAKTAMSKELEEISQQRQEQHDFLSRQMDAENRARFRQLDEAIASSRELAQQGVDHGVAIASVMAHEAPLLAMMAGVERTKQRLDLEVVCLREAVSEVSKVFGPAGSRPTLSSYGWDAIRVTERCAEWCIPDVSKRLLGNAKVWLSPRFEAWSLKNLQLELILVDGEEEDQKGKCSVALWADIGSRLDFRFYMGAEIGTSGYGATRMSRRFDHTFDGWGPALAEKICSLEHVITREDDSLHLGIALEHNSPEEDAVMAPRT